MAPITTPEPTPSSPSGGRRLPSWCNVHPWFPWIAPFVLYVALLSLTPYLPLDPIGNHLLRIAAIVPILVLCSSRLITWRLASPLASLGIGILVFVIWVGPDLLFPGYRTHWLFSNSVLGEVTAPIANDPNRTPLFFLLRIIVSVLMVPVLEELFWRGFLMRILIRGDFHNIPLGTYSRDAFLIVAVLFALEHGAYWDVGLAAGLIYNFWMVRTKSLADLVWAHAVTNGLLAAYVIWFEKWEYWP